jgi:hypothetical protein
MRNRSSRRRVLSAVWLTLVLAAAAHAQQDAWSGVERVVAVGDVHGDYEQFVKALRAGEVVDEKNDWIAGKTHLVQTGDVLDRGPDSRKAIDLLMKLEGQAAKAGGAVHALIGNHEAMVLMGDWRYLNPDEEKSYGGAEELRKLMSAEGVYGKWIRSHNAAIKINDVLFVHAGITSECAKLSLAQINKAIRDGLGKPDFEGIGMDPGGPLWDRALALAEDDEVAKELDAVLKKYDARRMVIGHTVSTEGIRTRAGGRLVRIDVGMSAYYGGPAACLVIEKGEFYEVRYPKAKRALQLDGAATQPAPALP